MPGTQPWTFCAPAWCTSLVASVAELHQCGVLCDTSLKTSDGGLFTAHSVVLAASSPFLASILQDTKMENSVEMNFSSKAIEQVLLFVYSGSLSIESWPLLTEVCRLAEVLQLDPLINWCKAQQRKECGNGDKDSATSPQANINVGISRTTSTSDVLVRRETGLCALRETIALSSRCSQTLAEEADFDNKKPSEVKAQESSGKGPCGKSSRLLERKLSCKTRSMSLPSQKTLNLQSTNQTGAQPIRCQECGKTFSQRSALRLHVRSVHQNLRPFKCTMCGTSFNRKHQLQRHQSTVHACSTALKIFDQLSEEVPQRVSRLKAGVEFQTVHQCDRCDRVFMDLCSLQRHTLTHRNRQPKTCPVCGGSYQNLGKHMTKHKRKDPGSSSNLSASSKGRGSISSVEWPGRKESSARLGGSNAAVCQFCGKIFRSLQSLKHHEKKHSSDLKTLDCDKCGSCFKYPGALQRHKFKHHQDELHGQMCDICGGLYQHVSEHRKIHDENRERKYQCSYCTKKLTSKANLTIHERYHTGERPYKCRYCHKAFYISAHCHRHELGHRGECAFACELCGKSFLRAEYLKSHKQIHSNLRLHKCQVCGKTFKQKEVLRTHKRIHKKEQADPAIPSPVLCAAVDSTS